MRVHIQWEPDPEDLGYNEDGSPRARDVTIDGDVLVVWIDQFGTHQYCLQGFFDTPEVEAIIDSIPIDIPPET